jgi:hypothetical protein
MSDNFSPVSMTLAINLSPVSMAPAITEKMWQGLIAGIVDIGDKFIAGVAFKKFETASGILRGLVDTDSWKSQKSKISNLVSDSL